MKQMITGFIVVLLIAEVLLPRTLEVGKQGMVVSASEYASGTGVTILKQGGNAVDAAVAVGFALAVTFPQAGNLGGGGFAVISTPEGDVTTFDYREKAPLKATRNMYLNEHGDVIVSSSTHGALAAGIPGSVAGYYLMWERYGSLPWKKLVEPAYRLAKHGYQVSYHFSESLKYHKNDMALFPSTMAIFFPGGEAPEPGVVFKQPELARTLKKVQRNGANGFYTGSVAESLVKAVQNGGGIWTMEDLRQYRAVEREPVRFDYNGYTVCSMGPPSSGGICLGMILNVASNFPLDSLGFLSAQSIHIMVESERFAYANRAHYLGDKDFVNIPVSRLLSQTTADSLARIIPADRALDSDSVSHTGDHTEAEQTTHFSVIDGNGMAVSSTTTLNGSYGCHFVAGGTGVLLNNEMDDFSVKPGFPNMYGLIGAEANAIEPGKRMLSSMTPTLVFRNDSLRYLLGTPGGATIITTVAQLIIDLVDYDMDIWQAVDAPRFHHQWLPDVIYCEPYAISRDTEDILRTMGYTISRRGYIGDVNAIAVNYRRGLYIGVADKRRQSAARGY